MLILERDRAFQVLTFEHLVHQRSLGCDPTVFLIDGCGLALPPVQFIRGLCPRFPDAKYIVLDRQQSDQDLVQLVWLGFHGFLLHDDVDNSLIRAVRAVSEGRLWVPSRVLHSYGEYTALANRAVPEGHEAVTRRENEVLELVRRRLSNKEIGEILGIRESTVKYHLSNIFSKRQVSSRRELSGESCFPPVWRNFLSLSKVSQRKQWVPYNLGVTPDLIRACKRT